MESVDINELSYFFFFLIEAIYEIQPIFIMSFDFPETGLGLPMISYKYFSQHNSEFQTYMITPSCLFLLNVSLIFKNVKNIIDKVLYCHWRCSFLFYVPPKHQSQQISHFQEFLLRSESVYVCNLCLL